MIKQLIDQISENLKLGEKSLFGLDIGLSAVKVAEVTKLGKGKFRLSKFSIVPLPEGALLENEIQIQDEVQDAIKSAVDEAGIKSKSVTTGLFGPNTITRKLQLAGGSYEEISDQVGWEIEQYLPFAPEDANISFDIIGENEGGGVDIMVAAARQDVVENLLGIVDAAGFKVKVVDMRALSVINVFEAVMEDELYETDDTWIVMDIGAQKTQFLVYKLGSIVFSKEISFGGVAITEEIQRRMGVNYYEAEDLKTNGDENGNLPEEIQEVVQDVLDTFLEELQKTIEFYINNFSDDSIVGCKATGGSCRIPGILDQIEKTLNVDVNVLNPFDVLEFDTRSIDDEFLEEIAYRGVVSIGYALRELD